MRITLSRLGKRYNYDWIFKDIDYEFQTGTGYAVLGANGSGKSTFLKILSGHESPSEGSISYSNGSDIPRERIFEHVTICAPYVEVLDELTLQELYAFHAKMKHMRTASVNEFASLLKLEDAIDKEIRDYSSGMKQRIKLGLAALSDSDILLLDEPTTNLDEQGVAWYNELLAAHTADRIVVVCSNQKEREQRMCTEELNIEAYKN